MEKRLLFLLHQGGLSVKLIIEGLRFLLKNAKTGHFLIFFDCSHLMMKEKLT